MNEARLAQLEELSGRLFSQIDRHIKNLSETVDNLKSRIETTQQAIVRITQDHNKATRFYSPAFYPYSERIEIEPLRWSINELYPSFACTRDRSSLSFRHSNVRRTQKVDDRAVERLKELDMTLKGEESFQRDNLAGITSVSSMLVYHTYESLLVPRRANLAPIRATNESASSGLSTQRDYGNKSFKSKHNPNKSSSNDEPPESGLGPVPGSILKYHQESMIEPDLIDTVDILDLQEDDDDDKVNLLTGDLPDILPSLTGVVKDVHPPVQTNPSEWVDRSVRRSMPQPVVDETITVSQQNSVEPPATSQPPPPPPPPPPPMPTTPIHQVPPLIQNHESVGILSSAQSSLPSRSPVQPPAPPILPQSQGIAEPIEEMVAKSTLSGRDALLAEIRSAASKPKPRPRAESKRKDDQAENSKPEQSKVELTANPRDSLLASIREAAGKPKLRKLNQTPRDRRYEEKIVKKKSDDTQIQAAFDKGNNGGDLMSDLVNKLRARRDGISGSFVGTKSSPVSFRENISPSTKPVLDNIQHQVMNQVSSMIPVRQPSSSDENGGERSDGDFDDQDWN